MHNYVAEFLQFLILTLRDVAPIFLLIVFFQIAILKQPVPHLRRVLLGGICVVLGLTLFLMGLEKALFPVGEIMATQLSSAEFIGVSAEEKAPWTAYYWIYIFAASVGFATTVAEPSLIAVALKASEVSSGTISPWGLRITVAIGVAVGLAMGTFRIVTGTPLFVYILVGYVMVVVQTIFAPKKLIALAYDSGGVTTSTVTVPIVTALGLGLSGAVPGSNPAVDGFGLIAFASLFPIISVLGYAQLSNLKIKYIRLKIRKK